MAIGDCDCSQTVVDATQDGAYVLDFDRNRIFANDRLCEVSGFGEEILLSKHPERLVAEGYWSDEMGERYRTTVDAILAGETADERVRLTTTLGDGTEMTTETRLTPYRVDGEIAGVIGVIRDITEQVEREQSLEAMNERLEHVVSFLSHDLKTPIAVATGYLELTRETGDLDHLDPIENALKQIDSLVTKVLAALGGTEIEQKTVRVQTVARETWSELDYETTDATLVIEQPGTVSADRELLRRAIENLISNALEHGGSELTIRVGVENDCVYVADDGTGIPEDEREDALEFGQSFGGGTGIGLAIVDRVAELHDWTLELAESSEGGLRAMLSGAETRVGTSTQSD